MQVYCARSGRGGTAPASVDRVWPSFRRPAAASLAGMALTAMMLIGLLLGAGTAAAQDLNVRVERAISASKTGASKIGVCMIEVGSGRRLASVGGDLALIPASNQKLLTSGAALLVLGPDFVFRTEIQLEGTRLIVKGSGDPAFGDPKLLGEVDGQALTVDRLLEILAEAVKRAGVASVDEIVVDDRIFDRELVHPTWPAAQLNRWYCAEVSGVNFHTNVLNVFVNPTTPGNAAGVRLQPHSPWLEIQNSSRTVTTGDNTTWVARPGDTNRFTLYGDVRYTSQVPVEVTVHEIPLYFGRLLAQALLGRGVAVGAARDAAMVAEAPVRTMGRDEPTDASASRRTLAVVTTHLSDILSRCNTDSQNLYAEALVKRVGHEVTGEPGSWSNGAAVMRMMLSERLGPAFASTTVIADGSGMSRDNKVSPETIVRWLAMMAQQPNVGDAYVRSLATVGNGTLTRRFREYKPRNTLYAKSGAIDGVRCLSGYVVHQESGRAVAFSVMCNELAGGDPSVNAMKLHEQIVQIADDWLTNQTAQDATALGG
jgi:D-alanyl-D-alanine carboxypeptidase/D-alanyl-D-alanine-endopeptidase (penicillin-binding protein 4)